MTDAALAFGSNLGDSQGMIQRAIHALDMMRAIDVVAVSSFYRTQPWGVEAQPDFINASAIVKTSFSPEELLTACKDLERALGRVPGERWGPRLIDIDVLWIEGVVRQTDNLTVPHPRMTQRAFVLVPLLEIAPDLVVDNRTIEEWVASLGKDRDGIQRLSRYR